MRDGLGGPGVRAVLQDGVVGVPVQRLGVAPGGVRARGVRSRRHVADQPPLVLPAVGDGGEPGGAPEVRVGPQTEIGQGQDSRTGGAHQRHVAQLLARRLVRSAQQLQLCGFALRAGHGGTVLPLPARLLEPLQERRLQHHRPPPGDDLGNRQRGRRSRRTVSLGHGPPLTPYVCDQHSTLTLQEAGWSRHGAQRGRRSAIHPPGAMNPNGDSSQSN